MTVLHTIHDVKRLEGSRRLPEPYMDYVSQFFIDLYAQYGDGHDLLGFSPVSYTHLKYAEICLVCGEVCHGLCREI